MMGRRRGSLEPDPLAGNHAISGEVLVIMIFGESVIRVNLYEHDTRGQAILNTR